MIDPVIFLGPPGTGKTTTLLDTVDMEMERGVPPDRIGFMTFTKRGVEEAVSRASERFRLPRTRFRYFNTLHSAAFRHLGLTSDQVFTGKRLQEFGNAYGFDLHGGLSSDDGTYSSFYGDDLILFYENYSRITCRPIEEILHENDYRLPDTERAWKCVRAFREHKGKEGLFDFTDMIEEFVRLDDPPRLEVLIIDEAQDLSELQWHMVFLLSRYVERIYFAGDDDQTIFTWAGASERFIGMPGNVHVLTQSYRVPALVHTLANRIISSVRNRRPKDWLPRDAQGAYSTIEGISQLPAQVVNDGSSVMMLARTVKLIRQKFLPYCRYYGLPYQYFENYSIRPTYARAIDTWQRLIANESVPADEIVSVYDLLPGERHGKTPGIKHGFKAQLGRIAEQPNPPLLSMQELRADYGLLASGKWNEVFVQIDPRELDYINKVLANGFKLADKPRIHISTIHRVKGGQADKVIMLSDTSRAADQFMATNPDEETRVFYTGITRTYKELTVVQPERKHHYGRLFYD